MPHVRPVRSNARCKPYSWRELFDPAGREFSNALQYVDEVGVWVDAVQAAGGEIAVNDADVFSTDFMLLLDGAYVDGANGSSTRIRWVNAPTSAVLPRLTIATDVCLEGRRCIPVN